MIRLDPNNHSRDFLEGMLTMSKLIKAVLFLSILGGICWVSPFIQATSPTAPVISQLPPEGYTTSVTVKWTAASSPYGIYRYFVQKSTDSNFVNDVTTTDAGNNLSYAYSGLSYNAYYYFRVYAQGIDLDPSNTNPWDQVTNPHGARWSATVRTRCIPAPANSLSQPTISEISPGIYNTQDNTYYTLSQNPVITWTIPDSWPTPTVAPTFIKFSGGGTHGIGLKNDGTVWTWGWNYYGQLGNGTTNDRNIPGLVRMSNGDPLQSIIAISAGYCYSVALKNDGTIYTWGYNSAGQLGNGTTTQSTYPVQVKLNNGTALTNITAIATGSSFCIALKSDGTVWAWGQNSSGQLGDGTTSGRLNPVQVKLNSTVVLTNIVAIAAGNQHCIALKSDGTILTWGANNYGQLGNGSTSKSTYPVQVKLSNGTALSNITTIAAGTDHCITLNANGTVWTWGANSYGQLGNGTSGTGTNQKNPVQVILNNGTVLINIIKISGGGDHSRALRNDNTLWSWGSNNCSELGNGLKVSQNFPVQMQLSAGTILTDVCDLYDGDSQSYIVKSNGIILACGNNICGQLGDGTRVSPIYPVPFMARLYGNANGANHSIYLKDNGMVWAWGGNSYNQLGDGTTNQRNIPGEVRLADGSSLQNIITVASGNFHTVALKTNGTVWAWGRNNYGQIGNGTTNNQPNPVQIKKSDGTVLQHIIEVACGDNHTIALGDDAVGTLWAWGYNNSGQLGIGTSGAGTDKTYPTAVKLPSSLINSSRILTPIAGTFISSIKAGANHSMVLKYDGTVYTWGDNTYGQLGIGTIGTGTNQKTPVQVKMADGSFLTKIIAIGGGANHSIALKDDGTVWTWGYNNYGQLGIGTQGAGTDQKFPVQVKLNDGTPLTNIVAISGGANHMVALKSDGTVWTWGYNAYGQLGDGTKTNQANPVQVTLPDVVLSKIISITSRKDHTIVTSSDGELWAWGFNIEGQLGDGTNIDKPYPTQVLLGSKLSITECIEQPQNFTEYAMVPLEPDQTSAPTNWNLPEGKYIVNVGVDVNGSIVWSPGYKLGITSLAPPIRINNITSESKLVNGNVVHQTTVTVAPVTGAAGYKYYRRKNDGSNECLTSAGTTDTTFIDTNLAPHDGLYEYGYSTYNSVGLESEIKWGDTDTIVSPGQYASKVFVPNLPPQPTVSGPRSIVVYTDVTFNLRNTKDKEGDQLTYYLYLREKGAVDWGEPYQTWFPTVDNQTETISLQDRSNYEWYLTCIETDPNVIDKQEVTVIGTSSLYIDIHYPLPLCSNDFDKEIYDNMWGTKNQPLTFRVECNPLAHFQTYEWNFGDGTAPQSGQATTHTYKALSEPAHPYKIVVTATDDQNIQYQGIGYLKIINTPKGRLYADETWSGVHTIEGDINVPQCLKLTIASGTQVLAKPDCALVIQGELETGYGANFDRDDPQLLWKGIQFSGTGNGSINNTTVSHAERGVACTSTGSVNLQNSFLSGNLTGIHCYSGNISITGCNILNNIDYGIKEDHGCSPAVQNCIFQGNGIPYYDTVDLKISESKLNTEPNNSNQYK